MKKGNVSLNEQDWRDADEQAERTGTPGNTSAGIRAIIAEWRRLREEKEGKSDGRA